MFCLLALIALTAEALAGYPDWLFQRIGHPVTWIGRLIAWLDRRWNAPSQSDARRWLHGCAALAVIVLAGIGAGAALQQGLAAALGSALGLAASALAGSALIAQRSLHDHVRAVAEALEQGGVEAGRRSVSRIVGRDTAALDEAGVSRAAIESLAENFSDGVVAPLFWMTVAGLPSALAYKAINTADSMIGHKTERHLAFGWACARLDDLVNLPSSRLSALWITLAGCLLRATNPREAVRAVRRDAAKHKSPNAGWPEAAMAGALGIRLAGPRLYAGVPTATAWMGDGRAELSARDIRRALALYRAACIVQAAALIVLVAAFW
jgi:adenosylcobinamide-phosphate synthase